MKYVIGALLFAGAALVSVGCGQRSEIDGPIVSPPPPAIATTTATTTSSSPPPQGLEQIPTNDQSNLSAPVIHRPNGKALDPTTPVIPTVIQSSPLPIPKIPDIAPPTEVQKSSFKQSDLNKLWIKKGQSVELPQLKNLVDIANSNPKGTEIINAGIKAAHGNKLEDLLPFITLCEGSLVLDQFTEEGGKTDTHSKYSDVGLMIASQLSDPSWATEQLNEIENGLSPGSEITNIITEKYFVRVSSVTRNKICIKKNDTVHDAFLALIHELTHFSGPVPEDNFETFLDLFPDGTTYVRDDLLSSGGEVDAFTNQFQVQIWLDQGRSQLPKEIRGAFNDQGAVVNPDTLYKYIAEDLDYNSRSNEAYADTLIAFYNEASDIGQKRSTQLDFYNVVKNPSPELVEVKKAVINDMAQLENLKQRYFQRITRDKIPLKK